jgi:hypothetical protein
LKPSGSLVVSNCIWFTDTPSVECRAFMDELCPGKMTDRETERANEYPGYSVVDSFRLPGAGGWDHYYTPLTERFPR